MTFPQNALTTVFIFCFVKRKERVAATGSAVCLTDIMYDQVRNVQGVEVEVAVWRVYSQSAEKWKLL